MGKFRGSAQNSALCGKLWSLVYTCVSCVLNLSSFFLCHFLIIFMVLVTIRAASCGACSVRAICLPVHLWFYLLTLVRYQVLSFHYVYTMCTARVTRAWCAVVSERKLLRWTCSSVTSTCDCRLQNQISARLYILVNSAVRICVMCWCMPFSVSNKTGWQNATMFCCVHVRVDVYIYRVGQKK